MKKYIQFIGGFSLSLLHLLSITTPLQALNEPHKKVSFFDQANAHYRNRAYEKALELYRKIDTKDAHTYYNMGNCAYHLGKNGPALLYWRKAEKVWGFHNRKELLENITLLKQKLAPSGQARIEATVFDNMTHYLLSLLRTIPLLILQILFLLLWIFLFAYLKYLYKKKHAFLISLLFACIALLSISLVIRYKFDLEHYGVILCKDAPLRSGPEAGFKVIESLNEGTEVAILKHSKNAFKVRVNGYTGWVSAEDMESI
jgi:hypothetical protein